MSSSPRGVRSLKKEMSRNTRKSELCLSSVLHSKEYPVNIFNLLNQSSLPQATVPGSASAGRGGTCSCPSPHWTGAGRGGRWRGSGGRPAPDVRGIPGPLLTGPVWRAPREGRFGAARRSRLCPSEPRPPEDGARGSVLSSSRSAVLGRSRCSRLETEAPRCRRPAEGPWAALEAERRGAAVHQRLPDPVGGRPGRSLCEARSLNPSCSGASL